MSRAQKESDRFHREYYASHELFETGTWLEKPNGSVMEVGGLLAERVEVRALDLGAGVGRNSIPFVKLFEYSKVTCDCVEILPEAVERLLSNSQREGVADRVIPICSNVADFSIASNTYDMIMAMSVLEHAYDAEAIRDGIRRIQEGTRLNGFNCLSIATDLTESDVVTGQRIEPLIQTNLLSRACQDMLAELYSRWDVQRLGFSSFRDKLIRDDREVEWSANYCMFVAQKVA